MVEANNAAGFGLQRGGCYKYEKQLKIRSVYKSNKLHGPLTLCTFVTVNEMYTQQGPLSSSAAVPSTFTQLLNSDVDCLVIQHYSLL